MKRFDYLLLLTVHGLDLERNSSDETTGNVGLEPQRMQDTWHSEWKIIEDAKAQVNANSKSEQQKFQKQSYWLSRFRTIRMQPENCRNKNPKPVSERFAILTITHSTQGWESKGQLIDQGIYVTRVWVSYTLLIVTLAAHSMSGIMLHNRPIYVIVKRVVFFVRHLDYVSFCKAERKTPDSERDLSDSPVYYAAWWNLNEWMLR